LLSKRPELLRPSTTGQHPAAPISRSTELPPNWLTFTPSTQITICDSDLNLDTANADFGRVVVCLPALGQATRVTQCLGPYVADHCSFSDHMTKFVTWSFLAVHAEVGVVAKAERETTKQLPDGGRSGLPSRIPHSLATGQASRAGA
jgi:hypothetical protein